VTFDLESSDFMVGELRPCDVDKLSELVDGLRTLEDGALVKLMNIVGRLRASQAEALSKTEFEKLADVAGKLGFVLR